jgi:hypothetical protein
MLNWRHSSSPFGSSSPGGSRSTHLHGDHPLGAVGAVHAHAAVGLQADLDQSAANLRRLLCGLAVGQPGVAGALARAVAQAVVVGELLGGGREHLVERVEGQGGRAILGDRGPAAQGGARPRRGQGAAAPAAAAVSGRTGSAGAAAGSGRWRDACAGPGGQSRWRSEPCTVATSLLGWVPCPALASDPRTPVNRAAGWLLALGRRGGRHLDDEGLGQVLLHHAGGYALSRALCVCCGPRCAGESALR